MSLCRLVHGKILSTLREKKVCEGVVCKVTKQIHALVDNTK